MEDKEAKFSGADLRKRNPTVSGAPSACIITSGLPLLYLGFSESPLLLLYTSTLVAESEYHSLTAAKLPKTIEPGHFASLVYRYRALSVVSARYFMREHHHSHGRHHITTAAISA